jgi:Family of unknown function (DUF6515)
MTPRELMRKAGVPLIVAACLLPVIQQVEGQVRTGRRGTAVKGEEGAAVVTRHGAAVKGDEGYAAVGSRGGVAVTDDGAAAVGRRGAVVAGEEGYAAVGRGGAVVVGENYESYDAWRVAGRGTTIGVGTMLVRPPTAAVTITFGGASYWHHDNVYYTRVMSGGRVVYQVCAPPAGIIISTLPAGCATARVGGVVYQRCGVTYYQRVATGYRIVVIH